MRLRLGLQPHHFSFETSYASFHHRLKVISLEKSSLTPPRVEPDAPSTVAPRPEFLPIAVLIADANCWVSVTLTRLQGQDLYVCPVLYQILSLWQLD